MKLHVDTVRLLDGVTDLIRQRGLSAMATGATKASFTLAEMTTMQTAVAQALLVICGMNRKGGE